MRNFCSLSIKLWFQNQRYTSLINYDLIFFYFLLVDSLRHTHRRKKWFFLYLCLIYWYRFCNLLFGRISISFKFNFRWIDQVYVRCSMQCSSETGKYFFYMQFLASSTNESGLSNPNMHIYKGMVVLSLLPLSNFIWLVWLNIRFSCFCCYMF